MLFPWLTSRDIIHNGFLKTITVGMSLKYYTLGHSVPSVWSLEQETFVTIRARKSLVSFEELGPLFLFSNKTIYYSFMACPSGRSEPDMQVNWRNHEGLCGLHRGGGTGNECR